MPHMIDITRKFTDASELKDEHQFTDSMKIMEATDISPVTPSTISPTRRRKAKPPPIDINLANQSRALQRLPDIKSPVSLTSEYSPCTPYESPRGTPIYVHIYSQLRSPGSSTPFPIELDTPQKTLMPVTAIFDSSVLNSPPTATRSVPSYTASPRLSPFSVPAIKPRVSAARTEIATYPFARSKRLRRMLTNFVDPIDTDTSSLTVSSTWYRARTPIAGRWDLFRRPSQVRLAKLAEDDWYGRDEADPFGDQSSEKESEVNSGKEGSSSGWSGLPSPISPLFV